MYMYEVIISNKILKRENIKLFCLILSNESCMSDQDQNKAALCFHVMLDEKLNVFSYHLMRFCSICQKVVSNLSRNSSFSSPSSSRSSSLRRDSGRPTTLKTTSTARPAPVKTSPRDNKRSVTSPREARYSSLREKNISAAATSRSGETKTSPGKSKVEAKSTSSKVTTGAGMSKSWAKSTASTSSTTKQAMAKFDVSGASSSGKKTTLTSTRLEPLKVGTTRIRTVHTTTSVRSGSPQKTTAGQQRPRSPPESGSSRSPPESGVSRSSPESGSSNGPKQNGQAATSNGQTKPRKVVQERLKGEFPCPSFPRHIVKTKESHSVEVRG